MASITVSNQPNTVSPCHGELWYRLTSTDTSLPNWRYYAKLYVGSATSGSTLSLAGTYEFAARPGNGDGIFSPANVVKQYMSYSILPSNPSVRPDGNMCKAYYIEPGFGYDPRLSYGTSSTTGARRGSVISSADYGDVIKPSSFTFGSGTYYYLKLITNNTAGGHGIQVGDKITISKNLKGYNGYYDGQATVRAIGYTTSPTNYNTIELNILYSGDYTVTGSSTDPSSYVEQGIINDVIRFNSATARRWCYNGCRQYDQNGWDFYTYYKVDTFQIGRSNYLSPFYQKTNWKKIYRDNSETISLLNQANGTVTDKVRIRQYDSAFTLLSTTYIAINPTALTSLTDTYYTMQVGFNNIMAGMIPTTAPAYYDVSIGQGTGGSAYYSIAARYQIVERDCLYENKRICWLNRLGGYDYFNFSKNSNRTSQTSRTEWAKQLDWNYATGARSGSTLSTTVQNTWTATTDWLEEWEIAGIEELISSPDVYEVVETVNLAGTTDTVLYPIVITDTSFVRGNSLRRDLFSLTINYKMANKERVQNI